MTYQRLPPRPPQKSTLSRRDALLLLGAMGGAGTLLACGGLAGLTWLIERGQASTLPKTTPDMSIQQDETTSTATLAPTPAGIVRPAMVSRAEWGALAPDHTAQNENGYYSADNLEGWYVYSGDFRDDYQTLVVHHSVVYTNNDTDSVAEVQRLHMVDRGWADIGYHFLVGKSGTLYEGRDLSVRGTHVAGYNTGSVGVCLLGNTSTDGIPDAQWQALGRISLWLVDDLQLTRVAGHRDFNPLTECPGNTMWDALDQLATAIGLIRGIDGYILPTSTPSARLDCPCCTPRNWL